MKAKHLVSILVLLLIGIGIYFLVDMIVQTPAENQAIYNKAKAECKTELWLVYEDIGPVIPQQATKPPYPQQATAITGSSVYGYGCNRDEALRKVSTIH